MNVTLLVMQASIAENLFNVYFFNKLNETLKSSVRLFVLCLE